MMATAIASFEASVDEQFIRIILSDSDLVDLEFAELIRDLRPPVVKTDTRPRQVQRRRRSAVGRRPTNRHSVDRTRRYPSARSPPAWRQSE